MADKKISGSTLTVPQLTDWVPFARSGDSDARRAAISAILELISSVTLSHIQLDVLTAEPGSPSDGMIVYADGVMWDPGSGEGFYGRENGSWQKMI